MSTEEAKKKNAERQRIYYSKNKDVINKRRNENYQKSPLGRATKKAYDEKSRRFNPKIAFYNLNSKCKKKGLEISISYDDFLILYKEPCYYCDNVLDYGTGWGYRIDRADNNLGYITGNCLPCCNFCNEIKQHLLTVEETLEVIKVIIRMRNG